MTRCARARHCFLERWCFARSPAMLASQMVVTHRLAMDMMGRTKRAEFIDRLHAYGALATKLLRTFTMQSQRRRDLVLFSVLAIGALDEWRTRATGVTDCSNRFFPLTVRRS